MYEGIYGNNGCYYPRYQPNVYFPINGMPFFNNNYNGQNYDYYRNNQNMNQMQQNYNNNQNLYQQNINRSQNAYQQNMNNNQNMYQQNLSKSSNSENMYGGNNMNNRFYSNMYQNNSNYKQNNMNMYQNNQNNVNKQKQNCIANGISNNQNYIGKNNDNNQIMQNGIEEIKDNGSNVNNENGKPKNEQKKEKTREELILDYENNIRKEIENTSPLISEDFHITKLVDEYKSNEEYSKSVQNIAQKYKYIRKVRRDGNCFYRSFIFRIFEHICIKQDKTLFEKIKQKLTESKELIERNGYQWIVVEDFYNLFLKEFNDCFNSLSYQYTIRDYLDTLFSEKDKGNYLIYFIRFCIAAYLKENKETYQAYIEEDIDVWVGHEVEAIDHTADQIQIMACVNYFDIGVKIEYLNKNSSEVVKLPHDKPDKEFFIFLLYTPGHYDILYP